MQLARVVAETDAPAALALIENISDGYSKARAQRTIADRAIEAGQLDIAEAALRDNMKANSGNAEIFALAASLAQRVRPQLGDELWPQALNKALPSGPDNDSYFEPSVAMWTFYHARLDAAQSRALIEREWHWRLPKAATAKDPDDTRDSEQLASVELLIMAMGAVDPARALEMRAEAKKTVYAAKPAPANIGLAATLLMNDAERARWGVDDRF